MAAKKKAVAEKRNTSVIAGINFEKHAGAGLEQTDKDSYAIPFLAVIQRNSPQVDEANAKFIPEAKPGMLMNTVTGELIDGKTGVTILPCYFQRRFIRWGARGSDSSGFKGEFTVEAAQKIIDAGEVTPHNGKLLYPTKDGELDKEKCDSLSDTRNHFCLLLQPDGSYKQVLLSLASTQIKKSKQLITLLDEVKVQGKNGKVTPPTWVNRVKLVTVPESNDKGSWYGVKVELDGFIDQQEHYEAGAKFYEAVASGDVNINYDSVAGTENYDSVPGTENF